MKTINFQRHYKITEFTKKDVKTLKRELTSTDFSRLAATLIAAVIIGTMLLKSKELIFADKTYLLMGVGILGILFSIIGVSIRNIIKTKISGRMDFLSLLQSDDVYIEQIDDTYILIQTSRINKKDITVTKNLLHQLFEDTAPEQRNIISIIYNDIESCHAHRVLKGIIYAEILIDMHNANMPLPDLPENFFNNFEILL